ncbi:23S rRNA (uracil(1939)-C(5))-methyltransferase RlmD [Pseudomarimonas arenosa]|uniref:23S rRNA (uracil(1939)-C(5))-methyltransferase RlmD n=1 Tax=Pseudomarimonas arenosa TaxID=2774145 RepID=UPI001CDD2C5D|nr:23S rRNA (uracil(1939)-C(5))-methyltransferase RlmD [Pseudomarimonas arenosa]
MKPQIEIEIVDLSHDGRGVGRLDGKAVFVSGALPGERVRAERIGRKRSFDEARTLEVLHPSADRVAPECPHFGYCGGCALQHLAPEAQIIAKQKVLAENFERIGHVQCESWLQPLTADRWHYRRKARLGVKYVRKKERVLVGFRESADPRFIADLGECRVLVREVGERIEPLARMIEQLDAREKIPQIEVAAADQQTVLVFRHLEPLNSADRERLSQFGQQHGFAIWLQPGGVDSVHPLHKGGAALGFSLLDYDLNIEFQPLDFVQVNGSMNQKMIALALDLLQLAPQHRVLDLFCGLGNFTLPLARRVARVVGVEGEAGLVQRARDNAARNGIDNAEFHVADLSKPLAGVDWLRGDYDRLLLDPPRTGADGIIVQLPLQQIERIVYVSCHPGSLARDAGILLRDHGFRLKQAGVMDMFPHTAHVESIAVFERG